MKTSITDQRLKIRECKIQNENILDIMIVNEYNNSVMS